jgi:hypothetical protein
VAISGLIVLDVLDVLAVPDVLAIATGSSRPITKTTTAPIAPTAAINNNAIPIIPVKPHLTDQPGGASFLPSSSSSLAGAG